MKKQLFSAVLVLVFGLTACKQTKQVPLDKVDLIINNEDQLTQIIIYDVFTPHVASRVVEHAKHRHNAVRLAVCSDDSSSICTNV